MAEGNGSAKWSIAFWVMTTVCFGGLCFIGTQAIAIDLRARQAAETVDMKSLGRFTENRQSILQLMKENAEAHQNILVSLQDIKTRLGIRYRDDRG